MSILPRRPVIPYRRLLGGLVLWALLLFILAFTFNVIGVYLAGSADAWLQWLEEHRLHLLVWRLCVYAVTAGGWIWARRRLLQRNPESRELVRFMERIALPWVLLMEISQWLSQA
ncbi:hypothetical protein G3N58_21805 [Paraburkholderia sp. Ac-20342]|uniref:hypothetical protein n=1 Tax=Paraburkholderia sp. Ac-20342 TaxID=2703889 RepID=UPI00197D64A8|nr:hypothetical protein [Paraburkholderia sp. Ac-20342]MBN3849437.1 hypothetical protein [Paraburkholderia sp. Ac-20342]